MGKCALYPSSSLPSLCIASLNIPYLLNALQQAQLYYAGKSRYLGVFKNKTHALKAYDVAREYLMHDEAAVNANESSAINLHISHARKLAKQALEK